MRSIFLIFPQNIGNWYTLASLKCSSSNMYLQCVFWAKIAKNYVYPCQAQFYYLSRGLKGLKWASFWENPIFAYAKTKTQISFAVVFATWIVQYLFYLNPKFQVSSYIQWFSSPDRFSQSEAQIIWANQHSTIKHTFIRSRIGGKQWITATKTFYSSGNMFHSVPF